MYVVLLDYAKPVAELDRLRERHLDHMRAAYERGVFLVSGPRVPRTGAVMLAHGVSRAELEAVLDADPYVVEGAASYEIVEFTPGLSDARLADLR